MHVYFVELNVNHYYSYLAAAVTQLSFGVKSRSGVHRGKYKHRNSNFVGNTNFTDLQNHIIILAEYYMCAARCNNCMPSGRLFVAKVYNTLAVEENIFRGNNTINKIID